MKAQLPSLRRTPARNRPHGHARPAVEPLEDRAVPTVVFPTRFGAESASDHHGWELSNSTVQPIFWGSYWNTAQGAQDMARDVADLRALAGGPYFSGLSAYFGSAPTVGIASGVIDASTEPPSGSVADDTLTNAVVDEMRRAILQATVPYPYSYGSSQPVYLVVTPPTTNDAGSNGGVAAGWNVTASATVLANLGGSLWPFLEEMPLVWCSGSLGPNSTSTTLGHELAEVITDPWDPQSPGFTVTEGASYSQDTGTDDATDDQVADHEARDYGYRLGGMMVQPYWSPAYGAYVVPDGNSFEFSVTGGTFSQFSEGKGHTLTLYGGQAGLFTSDTIAINRSPDGSVSATVDGQSVQFDPGAITSVNVYAGPFSSTTLNITGNWFQPGNTQPSISVATALISSTTMTINLNPSPGGLPAFGATLLDVYDANKTSTVTINDQADALLHNWTINGGNVAADGGTVVSYASGAPRLLTLNTGAGTNNVDVEATVATAILNVGSTGGTISFASQLRNLANIASPVFLFGSASVLSFSDQADATSVAAIIEKTFVQQTNMATVFYGPAGSIRYAAGTGNDTVLVAPSSRDLSALPPLALAGNTGSDALVLHDENHVNGALTFANQYNLGTTATDATLTRSDSYLIGFTLRHYTSPATTFHGFSAGVTLDADNNGSAVDVEGTLANQPFTVNLGSAGTAVSVDAATQDLSNLGSEVDVHGGAGANSLSVVDTLDPGLTLPVLGIYTSYLMTGQAITRTTYQHSRIGFSIRTDRTVGYSGMSSVSLATDNNGTPVDVEGTAAPTTVNVGAGSTAVSVTKGARNLGQLGADLTVNGGAGTDSLAVDDSLDPNASVIGTYFRTLYNYTVTGQSLSRTATSISIINVTRSTRSVNYSAMRGGVSLATDNNATPVNVASATGPSAVTVSGGTGSNTLNGPGAANSWSLNGANAGSLDGWLSFRGFASLGGGGVADGFDFSPGGSLAGNIAEPGGGVALLNYARLATPVNVNLASGTATGVGGSVSGIQGVVGGSGANVLVGSGRSLLIGGAGPSQLTGGAADSLLIAGTTNDDLLDSALEAILAEWLRTDLSFSQRVADLTYGGGRNGSFVLTTATVRRNGQANAVTSGSGPAWIFAASTDPISQRKAGDLVTILP